MSDNVVLRPDVFHTPERKIRLLLASLPFFAGLLSPNGRVLECNFGTLGQPLDDKTDWVGRSFETGPWWNYSETSRSDILIMMGRAREGERVSQERLYRKPDGTMGVMSLTLDPLFAPYGQPDAVLVMAVDVTERRRASEKAEDIAHDMSHRLRNSFTIMRLLATRSDKAMDERLARIRLSTRLSRVRMGHDLAYRYLFFDVPIAEVVENAVNPDQVSEISTVPVSVPSEHIQALLLALGELAAAGRPARVEALRQGQSGLRLTWVEAGERPAALMPTGLSEQLVDIALAMQVDGTVQMENTPDGFRWQLDMPVTPSSAAPESPDA